MFADLQLRLVSGYEGYRNGGKRRPVGPSGSGRTSALAFSNTSSELLNFHVRDSENELEVVRTKTSFRVSRVRSDQNPDVRAARKQVRDAAVIS